MKCLTNLNKDMMPMGEYHVKVDRKARQDICDIGDYISEILLQPSISNKIVKGLRKSITNLQYFPYQFPIIQDAILYKSGMRCMPYKNYYIIYVVNENTKSVIIIRVIYNKRNWRRILS